MADLEPAGPPPPPVPRASDADRERTAELLRTAGGRGQLDVEELDERLAAAFTARTREELATLTADLPDDGHHATAVEARPDGAVDWVVSVMSGNDRRGRWRVGSRVRVVNVMGGGDIDLSEAELTGPVTEITVVSVMGGADIRVPDGARVEVSKLGIMGGNDVKLGSAPVPDGAPLIRIRLFALVGGNNVARGRRRSRKEKHLH